MFERNRIADTLRSAREKRGLTVEQAAAAAGIPKQYLRLLEGESNVRIGVSDELYLIPFFRKYASFMSIDAEELLPEFLGVIQHVAADTSPPLRLAYRSRFAGLWKPIAVLGTIALAVTLLLRQAHDRPSFDDASSDETATSGSIAATSVKAHVVASSPIPSAAPTENSSATPTGSQTPRNDATTTGTHEFMITANEDAWLALGTDDQPVKQYLLRAGESRTWTGARFSLTVGNAGGVSLSLDGRELPPIGKRGQVVRNLRFPDVVPSPSVTAR